MDEKRTSQACFLSTPGTYFDLWKMDTMSLSVMPVNVGYHSSSASSAKGDQRGNSWSSSDQDAALVAHLSPLTLNLPQIKTLLDHRSGLRFKLEFSSVGAGFIGRAGVQGEELQLHRVITWSFFLTSQRVCVSM